MSVIFGKYFIQKQFLSNTDLIKMRDQLNHWNADDVGLWRNEYVGLGHLMLWNTPESLYEKLPFESPKSGNIITADARIDNRTELITSLGIKNESLPDSALILATYDKYGENCVRHLLGDFAFVIWDLNKEELFCARDHMGVRPFFYYYDGKKFIWASNLKGITSVLDNISLNDDFVNTAICLARNSTSSTCFKNILKLEPAYSLTVNSSGITSTQYWDIREKKTFNFQTEKEYKEYLTFLLEDAIKCRMRTSFAIGTQLSGGLDSSAILGIASKLWEGKWSDFHTFTNNLTEKYKGKVFPYEDESDTVKKIIIKNKITNSHFVGTEFDNYLEILKNKINRLGGLFSLGTEGMTLELSSIAQKNNVRTVLSGFLGDSGITFSPGDYQSEMLLQGKWKTLIFYLKDEDKSFYKFLKVPLRILKKYLKSILSINSWKKDELFLLKKEFVSPNVKENIKKRHYPPTVFSRKWQLQLLTAPNIDKRFILENITGKEWKVETVYPLVDKRIIELGLALPIELKIKGGVKRYLFKQTVKEYLVQEVYDTNKIRLLTLPLLHKNFLNSYEKLVDFIEKNETKEIFKHIDFVRIKSILANTKNMGKESKSMSNHAMIICHFTFLYMLYTLEKLD